MDSRLLARAGAIAFVALAITMTALELREEPKVMRLSPDAYVQGGEDPLPAKLSACAALGEGALASADCRAAWLENRHRFLGLGSEPAVARQASPANEGIVPAAAGGAR